MPLTAIFAPKNHLLKHLPAADLARLRPFLKRVELPFGQVMSEAGDVVEGVIFIEEGIASILVVLKNGASIEVALVGAEGVAGIPALFNAKKSPYRVVVQGAGFGYRLGNGALRRVMQEDGELNHLLLQAAYRVSLETAQTAACNRLHEAEERLARWLLLMDDRNPTRLLTMTHEFLGNMLGTRRSTVTIASGILQRAGLIQHSRGHIRVVNRPGLEAAACECYALMRNSHPLPRAAAKVA
ncbi:MAG: Crp/Fnr family transcriptional regulator [Acidobacteriota bacterium]|nr:Crp/Fnr family transcriptional regulator [Acidobacteriota bacterium]